MSDPAKCCDCGSTITPTEDGEYPEGRRVSVTFNMHDVPRLNPHGYASGQSLGYTSVDGLLCAKCAQGRKDEMRALQDRWEAAR